MFRIGLDEGVVAGIFVDVDGDAAEGRYFPSEFIEAGVVLSFSFVGFGGHFEGMRGAE